MWPFTKKHSSLAELSAHEHLWSVAQGVFDDQPILVRINTSVDKWIGHPDLNLKLGFALPLNNPNPGGFGTGEENLVLQEIEDLIYKLVEKRCTGLPVLVISNGVMKEFVFYIKPGPDLKQLHQDIQAQVQTHEVQCIGAIEQKWDSYMFFKNMMKHR
jgi:hypothetical protein